MSSCLTVHTCLVFISSDHLSDSARKWMQKKIKIKRFKKNSVVWIRVTFQILNWTAVITVTRFPTFCMGYTFSHAWHQLHVFPCLAPVTYFPCFEAVTRFPVLGTGYMFSHASHRLHVFPCFPQVTRFPVLPTGYMFSHAWHQLHIFHVLQWLHVFPRLAPVTCFPPLGTSYMFSHASHRLQPVICFTLFSL